MLRNDKVKDKRELLEQIGNSLFYAKVRVNTS